MLASLLKLPKLIITVSLNISIIKRIIPCLGVEEKTTICKNKKGGQPKWFSARKVCVTYKTNGSAGKKNRIIEFNGGVMNKDAFKGKFD